MSTTERLIRIEAMRKYLRTIKECFEALRKYLRTIKECFEALEEVLLEAELECQEEVAKHTAETAQSPEVKRFYERLEKNLEINK